MTRPRVAIVHDYLTQRGGAERVVLAMARAFPDAPVHTSLYLPEGTFPEFRELDVRPMTIDRIPGLRRRHRLALPLLAPAFSATGIDADVVVCSSSGWAHGVRTAGRKLVYCYNPARWLYQREQYAPSGSAKALAATALGAALRRWDARSARTADRYLAISSIVRERIRGAYGIEADLLMPPTGVDRNGGQRAVEGFGQASSSASPASWHTRTWMPSSPLSQVRRASGSSSSARDRRGPDCRASPRGTSGSPVT